MATKLKADGAAASGAPPPPVTVDNDAFLRFLGDASAAAQGVSDANNRNMEVWKRTDAMNIHRAAAKDTLRLSKMDPSKRADYLRAFDRYREMAGLDARQQDLLDPDMDHPEILAKARTAGAEAFRVGHPIDSNPGGTPARAASWESGFKEAAEIAKHAKAPVGTDAKEPAKVFGDGDDADDDFGADEVFGAGKRAGLAGKNASTNPNPEGSPAFRKWYDGWQAGQAELVTQTTTNGSGLQGKTSKASKAIGASGHA
jgi:hypothetical protein